MRAIIVAPGQRPGYGALVERRPVELIPLVDRPVIQHVVELLVEHGFDEIDFLISHLPEQLEAFLGDGTRWGARFAFHLAPEPDRPYDRLAALDGGSVEGPVYLAHADCLPGLPDGALSIPPDLDGVQPVCWREAGAAEPLWTGWGWIAGPALRGLPATREELDQVVLGRSMSSAATFLEAEPARLVSPAAHLQAQARLLGRDLAPFAIRGREREPGVWVGRSCVLHPSAQLLPPVYLGDQTRIGREARVGPRTVVCAECVVDAQSTAADSLILPGGYVGELLELDHVIVDHGLLFNVRLDASVRVPDDFILGSLVAAAGGRRGTPLLDRGLAVLLLAVTWPLLLAATLILAAFRSRQVRRDSVVRLPCAEDPLGWRTYRLLRLSDAPISATTPRRHLLTRFLPGLVQVALGRLALVGTPPRNPQEIHELPADWRAVYLNSRSGLISEAEARWEAPVTTDEQYAVEAMAAVQGGAAYTLRVLSGYVRELLRLRRFRPGRSAPAGP